MTSMEIIMSLISRDVKLTIIILKNLSSFINDLPPELTSLGGDISKDFYYSKDNIP